MIDEEMNAMITGLDTISGLRGMDAEVVQNARAAITTLRAQLDEARAGELAWAETAKMHLKAEQAFLSWLRDAGEHLRDEGVTICDDGTDSGEVLAAKVAECVGSLKTRADRAEAALAAQIEANALIDPKKFLELVIYAAKEAREKALREAADAYFIPKFCTDNDREKVEALHAFRAAILALIEEEKTK